MINIVGYTTWLIYDQSLLAFDPWRIKSQSPSGIRITRKIN